MEKDPRKKASLKYRFGFLGARLRVMTAPMADIPATDHRETICLLPRDTLTTADQREASKPSTIHQAQASS